MTKFRSVVFAACLIATVALTSRPATAGVLYSNLGPSNEFDATAGFYVEGTKYNGQTMATPFLLGAGATVGDAVLGLGNYGFSTGNIPLDLYIESDNSGLPGSVLATLTQVGTIPPFTNGGFPPTYTSGLVTFTCASGCTLAAGSYWLVALEPDAGSLQVWAFDYLDARTNYTFNALNSATGPWQQPTILDTAVAFRIDGADTTTPEPGSLILLASGLLGLAGLVRRRGAQ